MARGVEIGRGYIAVEVDEKGARAALRGFVDVAGNAFTTAAASAAILTGAAAKIGFSFNAMQEQASVAFTTLLGDGQKAQAFLLELQGFAAKTPFELPGLIDNARQLLGVGVAADKVLPTLGALGNAAGALGINQERFNNILLATTQAMGKGKLQGEELMQMVENGIPVWQLLSEATGKPVGELQKLSSEGKLLAAETLPLLFDQMNKNYGGAMEAQSQTLMGSWSSLKDNTRILLGTAFKPLFDETKRVTGALGELASSDQANQWATKTADGVGKALTAVRVFGLNAREELGPAFEDQLDDLGDKFEDLWPIIQDGAKSAAGLLGSVATKAGPALLDLAAAAGGLLKPALEALRMLLEAVDRNADQVAEGIGTAATVVASVAGPAFAVLGEVLKIAANLLSLTVDLVGDLSGPLGVLTGGVLAGVLAWRALSTVLGGMKTAWSLVAPAAVAGRLGDFGKKVDNVALSAGVFTEKVTRSANAGEKVASAGSKVGSAMTKVGSALPIVGIAAVGLGIAFEAAARQSEELAQGLLKGGSAAEQAREQIAGLRALAAESRGGIPIAGDFLGNVLGGQADNAEAAHNRMIESMTRVELAQTRATQAQVDYDAAVKEFGRNSPQAVSAQKLLMGATREVEAADRAAASATKTRMERIAELADQALAAANADLQMRQSQLAVTQAQEMYTDAVATYGVTSLQAQQASLSLESALLRAAEAARQKALQDTAGKTAAEQAEASNAAYANELFRLASAAGGTASGALAKLIVGLSGTELSAMGATMAIDDTGNAVYTMPDGKKITVTADTLAAMGLIQAAKEQVRDQTFTWKVRISMPGIRGPGALSPDGGYAKGGRMPAHGTYLVGEEGPELITPSRSGYVHTAQETAGLFSSGGAGGDVHNWYITPPPSVDAGQVAHMAAAALDWSR